MQFLTVFFFFGHFTDQKMDQKCKKMVLGKLIDHFKNYFLLRYNIYDFLKKISGCLWPTRLVRTHCALGLLPQAVWQVHQRDGGPNLSDKLN